MRLKDKVAIITGGANGIGKAVVEMFADHGAKVAIWDLDDDVGNTFAEELLANGKDAIYQHVDVSDSQEVDKAVADVLKQWNQIDVLINNAGILRDGQLVKYKDGLRFQFTARPGQ